MTQSTTVSIIILTYNNWKLLENAITSVSSQITNEFNIEVIISDDGTPDFDIKYIEEKLSVSKLINRTHIIVNKVNIGTVRSLNNAIKQAKGNIIIPLSADDLFYDKTTVSKIVKFFDDNKDAMIATGLQIPFDDIGEYDPIIKPKHYHLFNTPNRLLKYIASYRNIISGASTYYRTSLFDRYGYFDESYRLLEDYPYYINLLKQSEKIHLLQENVIKYRLGGISTEKKIHPQLEKDLRRARAFAANTAKISILKKRSILYKKSFTDEEREKYKFKYIEQYLLQKIRSIFK